MILGLFPAVAEGGRYVDSMFRLGCNPRNAALGHAGGSLIEDGAAFLDNPANLSYLSQLNLQLMYLSQFGLASYNHIGLSIPFETDFVFGVNYLLFRTEGIPVRPDIRHLGSLAQRDSSRSVAGNMAEMFSDREEACFLSLARMYRWDLDFGWQYFKLPVETPVGVNVKYLNRRIYTVRGSGVGLDLSAGLKFELSRLLDRRWMGKFGIALLVADFTKTPVLWTTKSQDVIEPAFQWSWSYQQPVHKLRSVCNLVMRASTRYRDSFSWGMEWNYRDLLALQAGGVRKRYSAGLTISTRLRGIGTRLSYAVSSHTLGQSHQLSCSIFF